MADTFYFSRDTKVHLKDSAGVVYNIPVLDGFSFSQATNTTEVTLNEMESTAGVSRRARQIFTDSYAPAEWSFATYIRPFTGSGSGTGNHTGAKSHVVEEAFEDDGTSCVVREVCAKYDLCKAGVQQELEYSSNRSPQQPQKPRLRPKRPEISPKRLQKELPKKPKTGIDLGGPCASFSWPFGVPFRLPDVVVLVLAVVSCGARCSACSSFGLLSVAVVVVLVLLGCWFCVPAFGCS